MNININTDYIKLDQLLKLANVVSSGGQAKALIKNGEVKVNDIICTQRGKKLRKDDIISIKGFEDIFIC